MYDMAVYRWIIFACWLVFLAVWAITAFGAKPSLNDRHLSRQRGLRLAILIAVLLALRFTGLRRALVHYGFAVHDPRVGLIGAALVILGIGFAVWARFVIGRNWGHPDDAKGKSRTRHRPPLFRDPPSHLYRYPHCHAGPANLNLGPGLFLDFFCYGGLFIYSAHQEEKRMALPSLTIFDL